MKILMISDHADPLAEVGTKEAGGQNIYVFYLASFLSRLGMTIDVFTRWDRKNKNQIVTVNKNFRVIRVKAGPKHYIPRDNFLGVVDEFADNILKQIKKEKSAYDVIHTNYWFSGLIGLLIKKRLAIPMVHVYHSIGQIRFNTLSKYKLHKKDYVLFQKRILEEKRIARESNGIIATSPVEKKIIIDLFQVKPGKVKMIPIGVDKNVFHPVPSALARKDLRLPIHDKMLIYVGRIEWRKGIATLLFAFRDVLKKFNNAKLYIVGGGRTFAAQKLDEAERNRLNRIMTQLHLSKKIVFTGAVSQESLYKYYSAADLCVVPSYYEPFGIVPLEAMACGTPVVCSKTGGLQYTVKNGETGYLAKPRSQEDLSRKIIRALSKQKSFFSTKCLERVHRSFGWGKIAKQYPVYFEELIKSK